MKQFPAKILTLSLLLSAFSMSAQSEDTFKVVCHNTDRINSLIKNAIKTDNTIKHVSAPSHETTVVCVTLTVSDTVKPKLEDTFEVLCGAGYKYVKPYTGKTELEDRIQDTVKKSKKTLKHISAPSLSGLNSCVTLTLSGTADVNADDEVSIEGSIQ